MMISYMHISADGGFLSAKVSFVEYIRFNTGKFVLWTSYSSYVWVCERPIRVATAGAVFVLESSTVNEVGIIHTPRIL